MHPTRYLRAEGLAVLTGALAVYWLALDGPLWLLVGLFLAPDLGMLAYLAGPKLGSHGYNVVHTYVGPLALGVVGVWLGSTLALQVAAIWTAHIGADRMVGYGLKFESGFQDTHLSTQPAPTAALTPPD